MGEFYGGRGYFKRCLGSCENGFIYKGTGLYRETIGTYRHGDIETMGCDRVGRYEDGTVYTSNWDIAGTYRDNTIYVPNGLFDYSVGTFEGDGAEAAAYLLLMRDELPSNFGDSDAQKEASPNTDDSGGSYSGGPDGGPDGGTSTGVGVYHGVSVPGGGSGTDIAAALLAPLGVLLLLFCFGLIWWAIYHATGVADLPFLIIFGLSIVLGLFLGVVVFKISDLIGLYIETVITASIINIVSSFFTSPGYSIILIILIPPIVTALAAAIPTAITYFGVRLIRMGMKRMGKTK